MVKKVNAVDTSGLLKKTDHNATIKDIEDNIPSLTKLATTAALNTVEYKMPDVRYLVKKAYYDPKISGMEKTILLLLITINSRVIYLMQR